MVLESGEEPPIVLDLGTGLREWGLGLPADGSFHGTALVTHLHWDHVQGLPFFPPADRAGATLEIFGPHQEEGTLGEMFGALMRPPYFPVQYSDLRGRIEFHDVTEDRFRVGGAEVTVRPVPHVGATVGYRIRWGGGTLAYVSDHQQPAPGQAVADEVLELCEGADLLIHDAQYSTSEFAEKSHWGHSTVDFAVRVAREAGARRLALFHHDPAHGDEEMDRILEGARCLGSGGGLEVMAASEGLSLPLGRA